ncbi:MAG: S-layer homology domain-containing protein [Oscillospiraceae bacterium]|nr:S-layer homology domain-containing protein [Oscillospiraceae bacterium]
MKKKRALLSLLLTLALSGGLAAPAAAAGPTLVVQGGRNNTSAQLVLDGLPDEHVYSVQLELTLSGSYDSAGFTPDLNRSDVYSPDCLVSQEGRDTRITIYLTARTPLNEGTELTLGSLQLDRAFWDALDSAELTLLDRNLKELDAVNQVPITTENTGADNRPGRPDESETGGNETVTRYRVEVQSSEHGSIKVSRERYERGATVTVTVEPDSGFRLDSLSVTTRKGQDVELTEVTQRRFSFQMPGESVTVKGSFLPSDVPPEESEEPTPPTLPFSDVLDDDWFVEYVRYVYQRGMMSGTTPSTFSPDTTTTRGMIVTVLHRLEGTPAAVPSSFPDVPDGEYYSAGVAWAAANGIVLGYDTGLFGPYREITREQLAAILYRYAQSKGYDTSAWGSLAQFTDGASVSDYAVEAMSWAVGSGLISGMGDNILAPGGSATRAQVAAILMRFCENVAE